MKKFLSVITLVALILSLTSFGVSAETTNSLDPMNNVLFSVIAPIKDVELDDGHNHGKLVESHVVSEYPGASVVKLYADGCRIKEKVLEGDQYNGTFYFADSGFPAYLNEKSENKFIYEESGSADGVSITWFYMIEVTPDGINQELVATRESKFYEEQDDILYTVTLLSKDENGQEVSKVVDGSPMNYNAYYDLAYGEETYNDGLIFKSYLSGEVDLSGLYDINGNCIWQDFQISYYGMNYNIGYLIEGYNNGGILDWSKEDAEKDRRFTTEFTNIITKERYCFDNTHIETLTDDGYGMMGIKDAEGNDTLYLIKLKLPAIPTVFLNGEKILFDQIPVIENGRTLVPLRAIFEALGAEVSWDGSTNTVTALKDGTEVKLTINSTSAYKNGELVTLDVPAKLLNGRTLVPVRFIADSFGVDVNWIQDEFKVVLTK